MTAVQKSRVALNWRRLPGRGSLRFGELSLAPEEAERASSLDFLLAGVALGQMEAFAALCRNTGVELLAYHETAGARLNRDDSPDADAILEVTLRPRVVLQGVDRPELRATAIRLLNEALGQSLHARLVKARVRIEPTLEFQP